MKRRFAVLGIAIAVCGAVLAGAGMYFKYAVLKPLDVGQDYSVLSIPFALLRDDVLKGQIETAREFQNRVPTEEPTVTTNPETVSTEAPTKDNSESEGTSAPETVPETEETMPETVSAETAGEAGQESSAPAGDETVPEAGTEATEPQTDLPVFIPATAPPPVPLAGREWFTDALMIGDSRTVGMRDFLNFE